MARVFGRRTRGRVQRIYTGRATMTTSASNAPVETPPARPYIGGQAVLEGVMMRAPKSFAIVVRRRDGSLHVRERGITDPHKGVARLPLVRGVASLVESLRLGGEALRFSAEQAEKDMEGGETSAVDAVKAKVTSALSTLGYALFLMATHEPEIAPEVPAAASALAPAAPDASNAPAKTEERESAVRKGGPGVMLLFMVLFMIALPQLVAALMNKVLHLDFEVQSAKFQAMTGVFKLSIVIGYMLLIRRIPDIRRVFQYHGAEHKTISTYEAGEALTVENARKKTTLHPRCGTTFLVMVAIVSVLVFTAVGAFVPKINTGSSIADNLLFLLVKLPFVPVLAAITFEIQRVFARYFTKGPLRLVLVPGFLVQKVTTIEPDDQQLEIALASLRATLFREKGETPEVADDVRFESYEDFYTKDTLRNPAS